MQAPGLALYYATFPDQNTAVEIGRKLVEERLVACVNVLSPIRSIYRWEGKIEDSGEVAALFKTSPDRWTALQARYAELHPYDVPCLIELPAGQIAPAYAQWLTENL